jgi:hypothetical protein
MFHNKLCSHAPFPRGVRSLVYIGWFMKLAKKLVLSDQNKESCTKRKTKAIDIIYRRMRSVLPQRILMLRRNAWSLDQYITMAADMGHCEALMYYGYLSKNRYDSFFWRNSEKEEIFNTTVDYFTQAANQGHTEAQVMVGEMWTERMPEEAKKWMKLAATKGHAYAQFHLGRLYDSSHAEEAVHWYTLAATQGHYGAQYKLACKYAESGQYDDAVTWLRLASPRSASADEYLFRLLVRNPQLRQVGTETEFFAANVSCDSCDEIALKIRWLYRRYTL